MEQFRRVLRRALFLEPCAITVASVPTFLQDPVNFAVLEIAFLAAGECEREDETWRERGIEKESERERDRLSEIDKCVRMHCRP